MLEQQPTDSNSPEMFSQVTQKAGTSVTISEGT